MSSQSERGQNRVNSNVPERRPFFRRLKPRPARARAEVALHARSSEASILVVRVLSEFLVDPAAAVMAAPDLAEQKAAGDRTPRKNNAPEMPGFRPSGFCTEAQHLQLVVIVRHHFFDAHSITER